MTLYRWLARLLLPPDFKRDFGAALESSVEEKLRGLGGVRAAGVWSRETMDLVRTALREWGAFGMEFLGVGSARGAGGGEGMFESFRRDVRFAVRTLRRAPGFTFVVVATLALGIGANSAIFSVVDAVLLEQLPYDEADRMVSVWQDVTRRGGPPREWFSYEGFLDVRDAEGLMEAAGAWGGWDPTLTGQGDPEVVRGAVVSQGMLDGVFRVKPVLGRLFEPGDDIEGAPGVVVLSHRAWTQRFGADPGVIGRSLTLSEVPHTVVGVLPEGFGTTFAPDAELYGALGSTQAFQCRRGCFGWRVVARLAPGVSLEQARTRAAALAARLEAAYPETNTNMTFAVFGLREDLTSDSARGLWVLLGAVGFVLLIACTNVANLVLARAATREGELSVRVALGAGRAPILRQLMTESLVLAVAGGLLGLVLASWGTDGLLRLAPEGVVPRMDQVGVDGRIVLFTGAVSMLTGVLFGLLPAWRAAAPDVHASIRAAGRGGSGPGSRLRGGLAVLQVGMALVLLVGSGLLIRSFQRLNDAELGFEPAGVLTLQLSLPPERYGGGAEFRSFYFGLLDRLRAVPRVVSAGAVNSLPLAGQDSDADFMVEGEPPPEPGVRQAAWIRPVTEGYFETIRLRLAEGRAFENSDDAEATRVVIVNRTLADRYYGGDAVGRRLAFGSNPENATWRTIVGVAEDVRHFGIRAETRPAAYLPYRQVSFGSMALALRTDGDPAALVPAVRATLAAADPSLAASGFRPLQELVDDALASDRFVTLLLGVFAGAALLIAAVGIYGVIAYGVTRRFREMGIRLALGADAGSVSRMVVRGGLLLAGAGIAVGLAGAFALTRLLGSLLYDVGSTDPATFVGTTVLLAAVALIASWLPARRASRADPVSVLREE